MVCSPAHLAASLGFGFSLQLLQQFGGNLELRNKKGMLPIHEAQTDSQTGRGLELIMFGIIKDSSSLNNQFVSVLDIWQTFATLSFAWPLPKLSLF